MLTVIRVFFFVHSSPGLNAHTLVIAPECLLSGYRTKYIHGSRPGKKWFCFIAFWLYPFHLRITVHQTTWIDDGIERPILYKSYSVMIEISIWVLHIHISVTSEFFIQGLQTLVMAMFLVIIIRRHSRYKIERSETFWYSLDGLTVSIYMDILIAVNGRYKNGQYQHYGEHYRFQLTKITRFDYKMLVCEQSSYFTLSFSCSQSKMMYHWDIFILF